TPPYIYSLSLPDALPIYRHRRHHHHPQRHQYTGNDQVDDEEGDKYREPDLEGGLQFAGNESGYKNTQRNLVRAIHFGHIGHIGRSEEHTSELQSRENLVC